MHGLIFASMRDFTALRLGEERTVELWADRIFKTTEAYDDQRFSALVRATIAGAYPPKQHVQPLREVGVLVSYTSDRRLCRLLEGLVLGTAEHYGEALVVEEIQCMHHGDPGCVFTVMRPEVD